MDARKLVWPAVALVGGALLGRVIGIRGLVRAGMAALTVANVSKSAGLLAAGKVAPAKAVARSTRKRTSSRRSAPKKAASAAASTRTH
ncbi:MAG: hypothetical protein ACJ8FM_15380 [Xanthobacteraceae bacterium]